MCDCFHLAFPNWHAASSGTRPGRRLQGPEPATEDSICDEPSQFAESERPRPQGSSPVEEFPETEKYSDSDKECEAEHDPHHKGGTGKKTKKSGLGSMFEKRSTPKMSKLKEAESPESEVIVKTAKDGCAEGLIYGGGGKEGIFIKEVVPESPASKNLKLKEGDQVLSATVYFDNMSYEDAVQILEHAQAYKLKLCLKRKPEITETEPAIESDVIPEEDLHTPQMREQGKTKRRGEARISWPKFSSFGKGRKSRFTRSHSSSEAEEQRKLELSPTTSDTESPIKTQDALKYKKKHKIKLPGLTKRGRISSSEEQDTDVQTGQISGDTHHTQESDMLSPECLESPSGEMPEAYVKKDLKVMKDVQLEETNLTVHEAQPIQHKVELISIDSTLKTADLTVALADQESPSHIKSPEGKKKKKERSELKMKILGKDKSHKKEAKAKSSPKRLKTLGASFDLADHSETEKSDLIPNFESHTTHTEDPALYAKVEHDLSDVAVSQKYPQKSEAKRQKGKEIQEKQEDRRTGETVKLPKLSLGDVGAEEITEDPYERLAKSSDFRTQLPKREEIEIPGMEDKSVKTRAKRIKEPKVNYTGQNGEFQAETVQLSIDVDSVKEAVSKLPGYKLPKVDTSGMPIPEEITVIDANAQRISVKTPTKVVDTKTKHGASLTKFDTTSLEISKTTVKLPQITTGQLTSEDLLTETKVKTEKEHETKKKQSSKEIKTGTYKREDIIIPGKETLEKVSSLQAHEADETRGTEGIKSEYESDKKSKKAKMTMPSFGIAKPDIRIPDIGIVLPKQNIFQQKGDTAKGEKTEFLQEVTTSKDEIKKDKGQTEGVVCEVVIPELDSIEYIDSVDGSPAKKDNGIRLTGFDVNLESKPNVDISLKEIRKEGKSAETEEHAVKLPQFGATTTYTSVNVPDGDKHINPDEAETKTLEREGKGSKFKVPNVGISMPRVKGIKTDSSLSKKGVAVTPPPETDVTLGSVDVCTAEQIMEAEKYDQEIKHPQAEGEFDRQGGKFKMPKLGIAMPKIKGSEFDFSVSQKNEDMKLSETKRKVKPSDAELKETSDAEIRAPEMKVVEKYVDESPSKFKMPMFKLPKFGSPMANTSHEVHDKSKDTEICETQLKSTEGVNVNIPTPNTDIVGSSIDVKTVDIKPQTEIKTKIDVSLGSAEVFFPQEKNGDEIEVHESKFKLPKFGITMPKVKGPEADFNLSKRDVDETLEEAKTDAERKKPSAQMETEDPDIKDLTKDNENSLAKFKMPTFKLPKFGVGIPSATGEVPDLDTGIKIEGAEEVLEVNIAAPSTELKEHEGKGSKFKLPSLGFSVPQTKGPDIDLNSSKKSIDITLPEAEVRLPDVEVEKNSAEVEMKIKTKEKKESPSKDKMPTFHLPKLGIGIPSATAKVPDMDKGIKVDGADISIPEEVLEVNIAAPSTELKEPSISLKTSGYEHEGKGSKFKLPSLGLSVPQAKGPDIDLSLSKKDVDVTLPEAKAEVTLPDTEVETEASEIKVETKDKKGSSSKFKMPTFKLPKFGARSTSAKAEVPDMDKDVKVDGADICIPEEVLEGNIAAPSTKLKEPSILMTTTGTEREGKGSKFKLPSLGLSVPQAKGPDIDLSLSKKDVDVTLPEAKAEIRLSDAEIEKPSVEVEIEAPEIKVETKGKKGSPSKFKMPTFQVPKFGVDIPSATAEVPDMEKGIKIEGADISIPEEVLEVNIAAPSTELKEPPISLKTSGYEHEGKGSKFKLPSLGFSVPQAKGPDIDLSLSKKDVDVTLPEAKAEVTLPDVEVEKPSVEVEIEAPEFKVETKDKKGSPSKFKMPTFQLPKFGIGIPSATAEVPDMDKGIKIEGVDIEIPEEVLEVGVAAPSTELKEPSISLKTSGSEHEGKGSKFKLPSLGLSVLQTKEPDIDLSLSKKDVDVTLPEARAEVTLPDVEVEKPSVEVEIEAPEFKVETKDKKGSPSKFKMPTFKLPKFGIGIPSATAKVPDLDTGIKIEGADVSIPEEVLEVNIAAPSTELKEPSLTLKTTGAEHEGKGSKFKLPSLGLSVPQAKGPDIDLSLSKKDVDVTLPEAKAEVTLPDVEVEKPSVEVEIEAPEFKVETKDKKGSPSKFKMPTFKLPKFGIGIPSATAKVPDLDTDVKVDGADISIPEEVLKVNIAAPSTELKEPSLTLKTTGAEHEGKGSKFKLPSLGLSVPQAKGPDIDLSLSKKDVDVTLPEGKAEVKLPDVEIEKPSVEVEIEAPEIKIETKGKKGSPSKFKMPTFQLPKFGVGIPSATAEVPDADKGIKIDGANIEIPEEVLEVNVAAPSTELKEPSISLKTSGSEHEGKGSKFKLPSLGLSVPQTKGPDIDLSLSKKDVDVTLPEARAEVTLPDVEVEKPSVEVEIEAPEFKVETKDKKGSPSKFKMPTFKLPKFGIGIPSATAKVPDLDTDVKVDGADVSIPEEVLEVNIAAPSTELKEPSLTLKTTGAEHEGKGSKFKLPSLGLSVPQAKGPDIDLSLSKKDVDVAFLEAKAEVTLPDVKVEKPSVEVEIEAPEIKIETKGKKGSPSKFKMPTFQLPKFGVGVTSSTAEVPDTKKGMKIDGADIEIPEEVLEVGVAAPSTELKEPSISLKTSGSEHEGKGSKFKLPSLGLSVPQTKGPDIDLSLSKKDVDVTLPEAKAEVTLPDVEVQKPSVEIEAPEFKVETKDKKGSPSKFKMPTFKLPKFGIGIPSATAKVPDLDTDVKVDGADVSIPEEVLEVNIAAPSTELKEPSLTLKTTGAEHEGKGSKFKLPSLGLSVPQAKGPDIDLSLSKKDVDVTLPEAKAEVKLPDVEIEKPSVEVEIEAPEIKIETKGKKGSPSKFKMPTFQLPKFGVGVTSATAEVPDMEKGMKIDSADIEIPEEVLEVGVAAPSTELKEPSISLKTSGSEHEGKGSKFKLPSLGLSVPKTKGPDIDLSLSKKDVDVTLPEAKAEVTLPDVEVEKPSVEVEIEAPEFKVETKDKKGSPSKFKMPTFKLPKFGIGIPSATAKVPDLDTDVKVDGADISIPEEVLEVNIAAPSTELKEPSLTLKTTGAEHEGKGSKFKLPSLGLSVPQAKGPDIDLSLSKKDVDVTLPEGKAEVKLPDVEIEKPSVEVEIEAPEIKIETKGKKGSPSKFKMPTFQLPKFGVGVTSSTAGMKIDGADIEIPEEVLEVNIAAPSTELKEPSISLKTSGSEHEGKGSKFKLPSLGLSVPQTKGPDIDLSLSKKDVDVTLPEARAEVTLPDVEVEKPSVEVEIEAPEFKVETKDKKGSPSKFKMPTFKLPKFGIGIPSATAKVPDLDTDVKIDGADISIPEEVLEVNIAAPSTELKEPSLTLKTTGAEHEVKGSKFKLPSLGLSVPQAKGPDIDLSLSKKDVDVTLPEGKAEVKLPDVEIEKPSVEVEIEAPEIKIETKGKKGSPSKFKMPTFQLPKFGVGVTSATAKVPDMDKGTKIHGADIEIPEEVLEVGVAAPSTELKEPSISLKTSGSEHEGKGSKFKLPSLGLSVPQTKGTDIDLSLSKKDVDVTLPEAKAEVTLPDVEVEKPSVEVEIEAPEFKVETKDKKGSPSKFKMPTFKLPKFGIGIPSATAKVPDLDTDVKVDGADVSIPEEVLEVNIAAPSTELKEPSLTLKTTGAEHEGKGSKFKLPSLGLSVPQAKGPDIDLSLSKKDVDVTLPEGKAEVKLSDVEIEKPSVEVEIEAPEIKIETKGKKGSPSKFKMPTFQLPKFGVGVTSSTAGMKIDGADIEIPEEVLEVGIAAPSTELKEPSISLKTSGSEHEGKGSKFKLPSLGLSVPQTKGPDIDLSLSKKDVDVTLPEAKADKAGKVPEEDINIDVPRVDVILPEVKTDVYLPDTDLKESSHITIEGGTDTNLEAKLKKPRFSLPKFSFSKQSVKDPEVDISLPKTDVILLQGDIVKQPDNEFSMGVSDVNKGIKIDAAPGIDSEGVAVDVKAKGAEVSGSKFKMPNLAISMAKVKSPETDLSLSKKDVDISLPEVTADIKLLHIEGKETEGSISLPEAPTIEAEVKSKRPSWTFPKFSFSRTADKAPAIDVKIETPKAEIISSKTEVCLVEAEIKGPSMDEPPAEETETNLKKTKFSLPRFSFSKSSIKESELRDELPQADVSVSEGEIKVKQPEMEIKAPEQEAGQGSPFKFPKLGIVQTKAKGPEVDLKSSIKNVDSKWPEIKAEVKISEEEVKQSSSSLGIKSSETKAKSKDAGGSPLKQKMSPLKMPKFSSASSDVTMEAPKTGKVIDIHGSKLKEDISATDKDLTVNIKMDDSKGIISESETPKTEIDVVGLPSPSKFKLPSFKMPRLSFSKSKPEEEQLPADIEDKEAQLEMEVETKGESKSPKMILTSFGKILKTIDVEFDVPKADQVEEDLVVSKEVQEIGEHAGKQLEAKEKGASTIQDISKTPERTGWFKFPKFGLSSPSEATSAPEKSEQKDEKSPVGGTGDEEISPTFSVQSSDAFADISSAVTSEHVGPSISSPTKVTVKYSDPNVATGLEETHSNIFTSATRTELISVQPNLPEKITILSSGISSSSEDTCRLESGKLHVITTNIQATPEAQHAQLLTDIEAELAGGLPLKSEANETTSWTVEDSDSGNRAVFERHLMTKTSSERGESRETIVITKQITHVFDSSEPISGETASSIQRLRDSVHSEKMRFFDDAEK
ncbi:angiopoietin 2 [Sarotherodon galilaeus]